MPNIEIKAKCNDFDHARETAKRLKTDYIGHLHQIDTYFETKEGRLKLREINNINIKEAQLIPYFKEYSAGPMKSSYSVLPVTDPTNLKLILDKTLGTVTVVDKKREVFLIDNVRVHLDKVKNLGTFIEFEAVYEENSPADKEREITRVYELMDTFKIKKNDLLDKSYIDYLLSKKLLLEVLYSFENETHIISELKRVDVSTEESPDKRFVWLKYEKDSGKVSKLSFVSMSKSNEGQERTFKEGKLNFNACEATFISESESLFLLTKNISLIGPFKIAIENYFQMTLGS